MKNVQQGKVTELMFNLLGQVSLPPYQYGVGHHHHKLDEDRDVHLSTVLEVAPNF